MALVTAAFDFRRILTAYASVYSQPYLGMRCSSSTPLWLVKYRKHQFPHQTQKLKQALIKLLTSLQYPTAHLI